MYHPIHRRRTCPQALLMKAHTPKEAGASGTLRRRPLGRRETIPCLDAVKGRVFEVQAKVNLHTAVTDAV